jgi:hypothetical protein
VSALSGQHCVNRREHGAKLALIISNGLHQLQPRQRETSLYIGEGGTLKRRRRIAPEREHRQPVDITPTQSGVCDCSATSFDRQLALRQSRIATYLGVSDACYGNFSIHP